LEIIDHFFLLRTMTRPIIHCRSIWSLLVILSCLVPIVLSFGTGSPSTAGSVDADHEMAELLKRYTREELMMFSLLQQGQTQYNNGQYQECRDTFFRMTQLLPKTDYAWSNWGLCLEKLGQVGCCCIFK
jgi:hypothetical protein